MKIYRDVMVATTAITIALVFPLMVPAAQATTITTVNFDAVDTSGGDVTGAAVNTYLAGYGITLTNITGGTYVAVRTPPLGDTNVVLTSNPNYLAQWWGGIDGTSFDLSFGKTLLSLSVTIPQITSGALVPAWSLTALDSDGNSLGSYSGALASSPFPARTYTFTGPDIAALRVFSNVQHVAGLGGIPIDDLQLTTTPLPAALPLFASGTGLLGFVSWRRRRKITKTAAA